MKYPRVWAFGDNVWIQKSPNSPVLFVDAVVGGTVSQSTFTPDQLSSQPVEVEQTQAQEQP